MSWLIGFFRLTVAGASQEHDTLDPATALIQIHFTSEDIDALHHERFFHQPHSRAQEKAVRGHWGIESRQRGLDVNFREDDSRTRERTLGNNLSWWRRLAVTLLRRHSLKDSLRGKMFRCLMNPEFLTEVLTLQGVWHALSLGDGPQDAGT